MARLIEEEEKRNTQKENSIEISKELSRDLRTVKRFIANSNKARKRSDKVHVEEYQQDNYNYPQLDEKWGGILFQ